MKYLHILILNENYFHHKYYFTSKVNIIFILNLYLWPRYKKIICYITYHRCKINGPTFETSSLILYLNIEMTSPKLGNHLCSGYIKILLFGFISGIYLLQAQEYGRLYSIIYYYYDSLFMSLRRHRVVG